MLPIAKLKTYIFHGYLSVIVLYPIITPASNLAPCITFSEQQQASDEETLSSRRIIMLWEEQEFHLVKQLAADFLKKYPDSIYLDTIYSILGNLYYQKQQYDKASEYFEHLVSTQAQVAVRSQHTSSLYQLQKYQKLIDVISKSQPLHAWKNPRSQKEFLWFFYASEAFFFQYQDDVNLLFEVQDYYKLLRTQAEYSQHANQRIAEIFALTNRLEQAVDLFLHLAEVYSENTQYYLLRAANLQLAFSPDAALDTINLAKSKGEQFLPELIISEMQALNTTNAHKKVLEKSQYFNSYTNHHTYSTFLYLLSQSHCALENWHEVLKHTQEIIQLDFTNEEQLKSALSLAIKASEQLDDLVNLEYHLKTLQKLFPHHNEVAQGLFRKGLLHLRHKDYRRALRTFHVIEKRFVNSPFSEKSLIYKLRILTLEQHFSTAYHAFIELLPQLNPINIPQATMWLVECMEMWYQHTLDDKIQSIQLTETTTNRMINTYDLALQQHPHLPQKAYHTILLKKGEFFQKIHKHKKALSVFETLFEEELAPDLKFQLHWLAAQAYSKENEIQASIFQAEEALKTSPEYLKSSVHQLLFQNYYRLANNSPGSKIESILNQSADHLYYAITTSTEKPPVQNLLWLTEYYTKQIPTRYLADFDSEVAEQTNLKKLDFLYSLLLTQSDFIHTWEYENQLLEREILTWTRILGWLGEEKKQLSILQQLRSLQNKHPSKSWQMESETLFHLALCYTKLNQSDQAIPLFLGVSQQHINTTEILREESLLRLSILEYQKIPFKNHSLNNPQVAQVLQTLKALGINRNTCSEPTHFQATLFYLFLLQEQSSHLSEKQLSDEIKQAKKTFLETEKLLATGKTSTCLTHAESKNLFQSYLLLLEGLYAEIKANTYREKYLVDLADEHEKTAKLIYQSLKDKKFFVPKYVSDQAELQLEKIKLQQDDYRI